MSDVGWGSSQLNGHAEMASSTRSSNAGISRSQDDATVEYFFQRPQNESGLQPYGANKRWAVGDDSIITQGRPVTDMDREFRAISLDNDFSKKLWDDSTPDSRTSSDKGAGIFSGSPWSPREGPWGSPPDRSVTSSSSSSQPGGMRRPGSFAGNEGHMLSPPHPSEQASALGLDMAEYVLGRTSMTGKDALPTLSQRHAKNNFVGHGEGDADKKIKQPKTPSPFEGADKSDSDKEGSLTQNGLDEAVVSYGRITGRQDSPTIPIQDSDALAPAASQAHHGASQMVGSASASAGGGGGKQDEPYLDASDAVAVAGGSGGGGHGLQMDASGQSYGPLVLDPFQDYPGSYMAAVDGTFGGVPSFTIPSIESYGGQQQHIIRPPPPQPLQQQQHAITYMSQHQHQQQQQQQPQQLQQQQQFAAQAAAHQPALSIAQSAGTVASAAPQLPAAYTAAPYVINGQDPYSIGIPIAATQLHYVQTPWGIYQASIVPATAVAPPPLPQSAPGLPQQAVMTPAAAAAAAVQSQHHHHHHHHHSLQQQQQQHHLMLAGPRTGLQQPGGRPVTPSQIGSHSAAAAQEIIVSGMGHSLHQPPPPQQQQPGLQPVAHTGLVDFAGYQFIPAYYDQNGQLLVGNGRTIRLVSPAPVLINAAPPPQGFPQPGALAYNPVAGNMFAAAGGLAGLPAPPPQQQQQQQQLMSYGSAAAAAMSASAVGLPDYGLPQQRRESYESAAGGGSADKYGRLMHQAMAAQMPGQVHSQHHHHHHQQQTQQQQHMYGGSAAAASTMLGPLGLVQPPSQPGAVGQPPITPPPPAGLSGSAPAPGGFGLGNGAGPPRLYNVAPGAEAKYRSGGSSSGGGTSTGVMAATAAAAAAHGAGGAAAGMLSANMYASSRGLPKGLNKDAGGRSRLLEDFRNNRAPSLTLKDLVNHVVEFSQDQHGSRFIQQKLERATLQEKALVFAEIIASAYSLMTDVFGNYVIQKFFDFGSQEQKQTLGQRIRGHVLQLALQMYGCRVIQKALESLPSDMQVEIVKELDGHVIKCVKDQNGNHVVQKCIECVEPSHLQFILDAFRGQVFTLSTHPYGCRVVQRTLEHCTSAQTECILKELHEQAERLVQDQYGNYVIQHVLEHGRADDRSRIVATVRGKVLLLSQHKFASNVVEKCVTHSNRVERAALIEEVMAESNGSGGQAAGSPAAAALYHMMKDQYANYVVQRMLDVAEPAQRKLLVQKIRPHLTTLRKYPYGKHIIAKLDKYLQKGGGGGGGSAGPADAPALGTPTTAAAGAASAGGL